MTRWADKEHQFAGIDVTVGGTNFDEKVKVRGCLNQVYGYPSFEVSFVNRAGDVQAGWFAADLSADYYAFIGVYSCGADENALSDSAAVSECDVLWVKKQDVKDFVEEHVGVEQLKRDAEELREDGPDSWTTKRRKTYPHGKFWLTYSAWMPEKPVNLVFPRKELETLPHSARFAVTREGARRV